MAVGVTLTNEELRNALYQKLDDEHENEILGADLQASHRRSEVARDAYVRLKEEYGVLLDNPEIVRRMCQLDEQLATRGDPGTFERYVSALSVAAGEHGIRIKAPRDEPPEPPDAEETRETIRAMAVRRGVDVENWAQGETEQPDQHDIERAEAVQTVILERQRQQYLLNSNAAYTPRNAQRPAAVKPMWAASREEIAAERHEGMDLENQPQQREHPWELSPEEGEEDWRSRRAAELDAEDMRRRGYKFNSRYGKWERK